jgi:predicted Zn-dependent protease
MTRKFKYSITILVLILLGTQPDYAQSIELDKQIGAENAELVKVQMGIYDLHELTRYVRKVGDRLVANLEDPQFQFQFNVVDDPIPNAFALPGGYVYVTRGVLSLIITEDELACVMGHEIIHVTKRHSIKQMKRSIFPRLLELPGQIVGSVVDEDLGNLLNTPIETSNKLFLSSYSRKHETESDILGVTLASKAGYDPSAMTTILDRLSKAIELITNEREKKSYFDDHPYTPDRIKTINKTAGELKWRLGEKISPDFPAPLDGMIFGENPRKGVFQDNKFIHPDLGFSITFPTNWETTNQPNAVAAIHPDRKAAIFLGLEVPDKTPIELGSAFKNEILKKYPNTPVESRAYTLNGNPGYLVSITDQSGSENMYIHMLWVKIGDLMFKLIGMAPTLLEEHLKASAESLHTITKSERASVKKLEFKVVVVQQNETFETLNTRLKSTIKPEINAFLNGNKGGDTLIKGARVKIIVEKDY